MENTLLFGNGINRLSISNISWTDLLNQIKGARKFKDDLLPNTMIYERIILENPLISEDVLLDEFETKKRISELMAEIQTSDIYSDIFSLNFQHYLTTNYDYGFIKTLTVKEEINLPIPDYSTEDVYSIRRLKTLSNKNELKKKLLADTR